MSGLSVVTAETADPVTLAEAKAHCRITVADEDALVAGYLLAARQHVEDYTGRTLAVRTYDFKIDDNWPDAITLPCPPVVSVTTVSYVDANGATQTLSGALYQLDKGMLFGRIVPAYSASWPQVRRQVDSITVRFTAGYTQIPEPLRQAILLLTSHFYDNRQPVGSVQEMPFSVVALLSPYKVYL